MPEEKEKQWLKDSVHVVVNRLTDSGTLPWSMVALFLLALAHFLTRNLNSADSLALVNQIMGWKGVAWCGWILALVVVLISRHMMLRSKRLQADRIRGLETEVEQAREALKKITQGELKLEQ